LQEQKIRLYEAEINCRIQISQIEVKSKSYFWNVIDLLKALPGKIFRKIKILKKVLLLLFK